MAQEINLGGTIYISSKKAAEVTGYTQDYIGQLARGGQIIAQRVSGLWYVVEDSLRSYKAKADEFKPVPPPVVRKEQHIEASVSFDGKDYVSAQRAAEITGYHQDYVGQLARSGKVLSRQVGNRWFVDREAVVEHKKHNDELLAAVQAESVGLSKETSSVSLEKPQDLHFNYTPDTSSEYLPELLTVPNNDENNGIPDDAISPGSEDTATEIPIRVIRPVIPTTHRPPAYLGAASSHHQSRLPLAVLGTVFMLVLGSVGYLYAFQPSTLISAYSSASKGIVAAAGVLPRGSIALPTFIRDLVSNELYYRRDAF